MSEGKFVLDNSVVMSWAFEDQATPYSDLVLSALATHEALVPGIWPLEVGNVLVAAQRRRILTKSDSQQFLGLLASLPITVVHDSPQRVFGSVVDLAEAQGLSVYDASYLDLALRTGLPLATLDKELQKAAKRTGLKLVK